MAPLPGKYPSNSTDAGFGGRQDDLADLGMRRVADADVGTALRNGRQAQPVGRLADAPDRYRGSDRVPEDIDTAKELVKMAIANYKNRGEVYIPEDKKKAVGGFSFESINYMLGGRYRASFRP